MCLLLLIRYATAASILGLSVLTTALALSIPGASIILDRRNAIASAISAPFLLTSDVESSSASDTSSSSSSLLVSLSDPGVVFDLDMGKTGSQNTATRIISNPNPRAITTLRINSPNEYAGLELYDIKIGTPSRNVLAVRSVRAGGQGSKAGAERGMILLDYGNKQDVVELISSGRYPIEIRLYNLALGGDALGDLGRSIVTPEDALDLAASVSSNDVATSSNLSASNNGMMINTIKKARGECGIKSRRGDTMQIRYEARIGDSSGPIYDASAWRGTGQPFDYVLGNNDVLKGVDLGTYDMCPGEIRELTIPPELGYRSGSKLYKQIPPNSMLFWSIELVELNFVKEGMNDKPRDEDYY